MPPPSVKTLYPHKYVVKSLAIPSNYTNTEIAPKCVIIFWCKLTSVTFDFESWIKHQ